MNTLDNYPTINDGITLVSGPQNSGKSFFAERLVAKFNNVLYIATLSNKYIDAEMEKRIQIHKERRPEQWDVLESSNQICELANEANNYDVILLDSLGSFVSAYIDSSNEQWNQHVREIKSLLYFDNKKILIVAEEIGWSVLPHTSLGYTFSQRLSELTSYIANQCTTSWLVVNHIAINLTDIGIRIQ